MYVVYKFVPYEGESEIFSGTEEEVKTFFEEKDKNWWYWNSPDDINVYQTAPEFGCGFLYDMSDKARNKE